MHLLARSRLRGSHDTLRGFALGFRCKLSYLQERAQTALTTLSRRPYLMATLNLILT
jgi:hypothetical protein